MFSLLSGDSGWRALCASINCDSRSAQAMPAGPPPTITTSAGISGCSTLGRGLRKISMVVGLWQKTLYDTGNRIGGALVSPVKTVAEEEIKPIQATQCSLRGGAFCRPHHFLKITATAAIIMAKPTR